jgi:hypothetical protein
MIAPTLVVAFVVAASTVQYAAAAPPEVQVTYETGGAAILQNDGRYGADGTAFDASDTGQDQNLLVVQRTSVELGFGRHRVVLLYAPFEAETRVRLREPLTFDDTTFAAGSVVDHRYLFDGYRASYLYEVVKSELELAFGGSLQVRNADVAFSAVDGSAFVQESDIGLVFALKARLRYAPQRLRVGPARGRRVLDLRAHRRRQRRDLRRGADARCAAVATARRALRDAPRGRRRDRARSGDRQLGELLLGRARRTREARRLVALSLSAPAGAARRCRCGCTRSPHNA